MVREEGAARPPGAWCRPDWDGGLPDVNGRAGDEIRDQIPPGPGDEICFPYGVVEVKLQAKPPPWVKELVQSGERRGAAGAGKAGVGAGCWW